MSAIFISYRRKPTQVTAREIYKHLGRNYNEKAIFFDENSIQKGDDLRLLIRHSLDQCEIFLPLIDQGWIESLEEYHLDNFHLENSWQGHKSWSMSEGSWKEPKDWIVLEVSEALQLKSLTIIPVFIDGAMPALERLPQETRELCNETINKNGIIFETHLFDASMSGLIREINKKLRGSQLGVSTEIWGLEIQKHEAKYCIQDNGGQGFSEVGELYLESLSSHFNLPYIQPDVVSSARRPYDMRNDFVVRVISEGHLEERSFDGKKRMYLSREARKYLRRLEEILEIPKWQILNIEDEPSYIGRILHQNSPT
jgi:hypothetical protein